MLYDIKELSGEVIKAILPVAVIVLVLHFTILDMPAYTLGRFLLGAAMITLGLILFLTGIKISILPVGEAIGSKLPEIGVLPIVLFWAFFLGFTATLAEPPVRVLANLVEHTSGGGISAKFLIVFTALGIGVFIALAILRIALRIPLKYLFLGGYTLIIVLSIFAPGEFAVIAFDASGVTTGPVTVPVFLSLSIGITSVLRGRSKLGERFGMVGLASMGPIIAVMLMGVLVK